MSSEISESDDDPLADLLGGSGHQLTRDKRKYSSSSDEFSVDIPKIFQTVGQKNAELDRNHEQLEAEISHKQTEQEARARKLASQRTLLKSELAGEVQDVNREIENLLQQCNNRTSMLARHFYVFNAVSVDKEPCSPFFFSKNMANTLLGYTVTTKFLDQALRCSDVPSLRQANALMELAIERGLRVQKRPEGSVLVKHLHLIESQMADQFVTVRLVHNNPTAVVNLLRMKLFISAHAIFDNSTDSSLLYAMFFYSINDYNASRNCMKVLMDEFMGAFKTLRLIAPVEPEQVARLLESSFKVKLPSSETRFEWLKYEYEMTSHTLRLLQMAFVQRPVTDPKLRSVVRDITQAVVKKTVGEILREALAYMEGGFTKAFDDFTVANEIYKHDFEIKAINYISDEVPSKHTKTLFRLKELYHSKLGEISFSPCDLDKMTLKSELVALLGEDYEVLNYLHQKCLKHAAAKEDLFYDQVAIDPVS